MAWWCCLSLATPILCAFVCCDSARGFWLAGRFERAVATQLASSLCVARLCGVVLGEGEGSAGLGLKLIAEYINTIFQTILGIS